VLLRDVKRGNVNLDVRTLGVLSAVLPLILGLVMASYWRSRKVYSGFGYWVLANFCFFAGYILVPLRGMAPDFLSIIVSNLLIVYGQILVYEGNQLFFESPPFRLSNYFLLVVYAVLQLFFTYSHPDINARIALGAAVLFILLVRCGYSVLQNMIPGLEKIIRPLAYIFFLNALLQVPRAFYALVQPAPIDFFSDQLNSWYALLLLASVLTWTFYFFLLNSIRLELDLEKAHRELTVIANTDSLTGLHNRRHFLEHAEAEFERTKRYGQLLSILVMDIDNFKSVNDGYGHDVGDMTMLKVAQVLRLETRFFDLVARLGGDEFIIMLINTDEQQAFDIAERIRLAVEKTPILFDIGEYNVHLSVGIAAFVPTDSSLDFMLKRADKALYQAKNDGKNRVVIA
jgi:diguanylate cyclase (GGDEF)-like protein